MKLKQYLTSLGLGISVLCTGCIQDDRTECRFPLEVSFSYTSHRAGNDRLRDEVKTLRLYLYDSTSGKLCETHSVDVSSLDSLNTMQWMVAPGNYRLVAWGGEHTGRYALNSHTNHEDALMTVATNSEGEVEHQAEQLWHGSATDITVDGDFHERSLCKLNRMTANVNITTVGLDADDYPRVSAMITGSNAAYTFAGVAHPSNTVTNWIPWHEVNSDNDKAQGIYKLTTMRARKGDDTRLSILLNPESPMRSGVTASNGSDKPQVLYDGLLRDLIALHPSLDIDLDFDYDLKVEITNQNKGYVSFNIYINNWLVIRSNAVLE